MLDKLPSIIAEARYAELWGTQLDNDDDRNREIVIEKFLEQHSILPMLRQSRASASLRSALEWRRSVKPKSALTEATDILTKTGLQRLTRTGNTHIMWIIIDEQTIRGLPLLYEEFMKKHGLAKLGIAALENLASLILDVDPVVTGGRNVKASCVVQFRLSTLPTGRDLGIPFRRRVRDVLANTALELQKYYPGLIDRTYVIQPFDGYLDTLDIRESLLKKTTVLKSPEELASYLGADIPPEFGGRGMPLDDCDVLSAMSSEPVLPPTTPEEPQDKPLKTESTVDICEGTRERAMPSPHEIVDDPTGEGPQPQLIFSEDIGPPKIILDPSDLETAIELCPDKMGARLVWADSDMIVKYGHGVRLAEAEAMHLVSSRTNIAIPKLLSAYILQGVCYIVMSYEKGEPLSEYWDRVSELERQNVLTQLRDYVAQMRQIKGDFIGGIDSSPCRDGIFEGGWGAYDSYSYGPYATEDGFTEGIVQALRDRLPPQRRNGSPDVESRFFKNEYLLYQTVRELKKMNHSIVFTHGDLHPGNILVRSDRTVVILDWGLAGYWPDYWEFYRAMFNAPWRPSWDTMVERFVPPFYVECAILQKVFAIIWN
ncbi:hypothetical protein ASPFODRAFT_147386 [Aspergillus luchuensis CBS 106.47]|uniref:Aminoglycoside phosphotransferase domain-containing protein n=1 Tax=Aspergillus luchuensis (strain CBS 106.47) TaxID=1137211 RepID=A0A1M3T1P9_ASPLC|nr:hypothetical protein ASPFODRAFT_147386 [Aspergillus luchuensis CBS 106.47]